MEVIGDYKAGLNQKYRFLKVEPSIFWMSNSRTWGGSDKNVRGLKVTRGKSAGALIALELPQLQ